MSITRITLLVILLSTMTYFLVVKENKALKTQTEWEEALKYKATDPVTYDFTEDKAYRYGSAGRYYKVLHVKEIPERSFLMDKNYSFLDKSTLSINYFKLQGSKCALKIEARYEGKTYPIYEREDLLNSPDDLDYFVKNNCY